MPMDERRSIKKGEGRERNLVSQGVTAIYIDKKGKFRPGAGNNITRAKARHITPPLSKAWYVSVLARTSVGSYVGVKYPFHFTKTWRWWPLVRLFKIRSTSYSSSPSTIIAGGRKSSWRWFGKGSAAARFKRLAWNTLWIPGGISNL